jgi:hypothetical protein
MSNKIWIFSIVPTLVLGIFVIPPASASQNFTYTLVAPFETEYEEDGSFKPPIKLSQASVRLVLSDNCDFTVGKRPTVETRVASGKITSSVNMRSAHKLSYSKWVKDENGENIFVVRGNCTYVATLSKKLPASNFYQFYVSSEISRPSSWSYPYTLRQLEAMKNGIRETRYLNDLRTYGVFSPVPEIETPKVQVVRCTEGILIPSTSAREEGVEENEDVQVAYLMVTNGIYRPKKIEFNTPRVWHVGDRIQSHSKYFVEVEGLSNIELISENTPAFVTWRRVGETNFSTSLEIFYRYWVPGEEGSEEVTRVAKEKTFTVQISNDCKKVTVTSP